MFSIAGRSIVPSLVLAGSVCIVRAHVADDNMSDDLPMSVVMWICPDEPFAAGIGKPRHYRKAFETQEGLVKATARWWVRVHASPRTFRPTRWRSNVPGR
jgi:hypothetical protein